MWRCCNRMWRHHKLRYWRTRSARAVVVDCQRRRAATRRRRFSAASALLALLSCAGPASTMRLPHGTHSRRGGRKGGRTSCRRGMELCRVRYVSHGAGCGRHERPDATCSSGRGAPSSRHDSGGGGRARLFSGRRQRTANCCRHSANAPSAASQQRCRYRIWLSTGAPHAWRKWLSHRRQADAVAAVHDWSRRNRGLHGCQRHRRGP